MVALVLVLQSNLPWFMPLWDGRACNHVLRLKGILLLYEALLLWPTRKSDYLLHAAAVELVAFCSAFTKIDTDNTPLSTDTVCSICAHYVSSSRSVCKL